MTNRAKTIKESMVETVHVIRPGDLNGAGRLFGGILMQWIDEVAGVVAKRHSQMEVTTASIDNLQFLHGVFQRDLIVLIGKITYVGHTSMEVKVETYVENTDGERFLVNRAFLTEVALGNNNQPAYVPRLILDTEEERTEWERAEQRRKIRSQQRQDGFHFYS